MSVVRYCLFISGFNEWYTSSLMGLYFPSVVELNMSTGFVCWGNPCLVVFVVFNLICRRGVEVCGIRWDMCPWSQMVCELVPCVKCVY